MNSAAVLAAHRVAVDHDLNWLVDVLVRALHLVSKRQRKLS